ncbi:hypothetical protein [Mesorhizobium sp.]|uniref:hypothetical protein n=1 Tax=Mesorhizobium sp. TaxID=1871066 RepID=UPI00257BA3AD|nr:hypothetical protein [Mesorhizobium sp.]
MKVRTLKACRDLRFRCLLLAFAPGDAAIKVGVLTELSVRVAKLLLEISALHRQLHLARCSLAFLANIDLR